MGIKNPPFSTQEGYMKKQKLLSNIILVIAILVFIFSGYKLYKIYSEYHKGNKEYDKVMDEVVTQTVAEEEETDGEEKKKEEKVVFSVDFQKLLKINSDVVAWIRFDNPEKISYPVVRGVDNSEYLRKTLEGKKNGAGSIFMDAYNAGDFSDSNTFIYGHNMKNGSMFGQLRKYQDKEFCKQNPYFYIYTPDGKEAKYQVFAVCIVEETGESYNMFYQNEAEYFAYLQYIQSLSSYDTGVEVTAQSQIISLSTCTSASKTKRLLVHGVKVSEEVMGE